MGEKSIYPATHLSAKHFSYLKHSLGNELINNPTLISGALLILLPAGIAQSFSGIARGW